MSQNDFNIANQGFPSFRSDLNDALQALASNSSGATEPATTYAGQFWYDSTNDVLKFRNEANSAWIDPPIAGLVQALSDLGVTASAAELNKMDGVTASTAEINYIDGVTSNIQTQLNAKGVGDITGVTAGTNLTGGGTSGGVTVNLTASPNITSLSVGSSEVISSARQLKNIASVDATTVAALGAAGVGGGGGELELTAGEAITAGQLVSLNSAGNIEVAGANYGPEKNLGFSGTIAVEMNVAYSTTNNKFVMAWLQSSSQGIYAAVGTIASNGSITVGSAVQIEGATSGLDNGNIAYIPAQNSFVISWTDQSAGAQARACQISGTSLSLGSVVTYLSHSGGSVLAVDNSVGYSGGSSAILQYGNYYGGGNYARGITVSGTSISLGSQQSLGVTYYRQRKAFVYDSTANKTIIGYGNGSEYRFRLGTMSGNSLSLGSTGTLSKNLNVKNNGAHDVVTDKNAFVFQNNTDSNTQSLVITVSGTSISLGATTVISDTQYTESGCITDGGGTVFIVMSAPYTGSGVAPVYMSTSITGTTLSAGVATTPDPSSLATGLGQPFYDDNSGFFGIFYTHSGTAYARAISSGGIGAWIGIAAENISNGSTGKITVVGGINESQTGLVTGAYYGLPPSTGVLTKNGQPKIGLGISATKLFITTGGVS